MCSIVNEHGIGIHTHDVSKVSKLFWLFSGARLIYTGFKGLLWSIIKTSIGYFARVLFFAGIVSVANEELCKEAKKKKPKMLKRGEKLRFVLLFLHSFQSSINNGRMYISPKTIENVEQHPTLQKRITCNLSCHFRKIP